MLVVRAAIRKQLRGLLFRITAAVALGLCDARSYTRLRPPEARRERGTDEITAFSLFGPRTGPARARRR